ncbi:MAG: Ig-like domain-containing protein [Ardenticatenia bacterium]|nr:Ig-like domain-containing protein [Ardenticatenia bacterium]
MMVSWRRMKSGRAAALLALAVLLLGAAAAHAQRGPVVGIMPQDGQTEVWPGTTIALTFDRLVEQASVEQAFTLSPAQPGNFHWQVWDQRSYMEYRPEEPLTAKSRFAAELGTGAKDAQGRALLTQPLRWSFTTSAAQGQLRFGWSPTVQLLAPSGSHGLGIQADYPRFTADFALYAVDVPGFVQRYGKLTDESQAIDLKGLTEAARWRAKVDNSEGLKGVGLPKGTAPGLYVVEASHPIMGRAQVLLIYSDLAIVGKQGRQGLSAWTSHVLNSQPQAGIRTAVVDATGTELAFSNADSDGIARFDDGIGKAAFLVAGTAAETTLVGLDSRWSSDYWWWRGPWMEDGGRFGGGGGGAGSSVTGHLHTDRPIFKPGDTIHYKGSFRRFSGEGDGLAVLAPSTPISITFRDARNNLIATHTPAVDAFGSVHGELALGDEVATGNWQMEAHVEGRTISLPIKVEAYVKPDFEVTVSTARPWAVSGETSLVTVAADYYYGQPVAGADAVLRVYRGWWWPGSGNQPVQTLTGKLDDKGRWQTPVTFDAVGSYGETFSFEAEVTDASRRPVTASTAVMVHPADFSLTMESDRYGIERGESARFTLRTTGHDGRPVAGRKITVNRKVYEQSGERIVETKTVTTGADGTAILTVDGLGTGWFSFEALALDDAGRQVTAWSYAWVWEGGRPWYWWGGLELSADKASYAPGDKASILIKSPVTTTALISIERDEVYEERVVPVSGATPFELLIKPEYAPNVRVRVHLWRPGSQGWSGKEGELLSAQLDLTVPADDRRLKVEVLPGAARLGPGDETTFTVRVLDAAGRPVRAQLSLALADKAVLALAKDPSGPLFDAFWTNWPHSVATFDSTRPGYTAERGREDAGGPGGGTPAPANPGQDKSADQQPTVVPRKDFRDTAYWNPILETGADGRVTVTIKLPDNLTTWVAIARAITVDTHVGEGRAEVLVAKDLSVDAALPRFAVQGDQFALDLLARNDLDAGGLKATLSLEAPGLVQLDAGVRELDLPKGQLRTARWSVVASKIGQELVSARMDTAAGGDAVELPFKVQAFSVPERFVAAGAVDSQAYETFAIPYNAIPDESSVEIRLAPSAALGVLDGIEDLIGYPYGCVEQTMSRVLPNAVIGRLAKAVQLDDPELLAKLPEYMAVGLQKLYGFQNTDGGWGWWYGSTGNLYTTAYVLHGLQLVEEAGFAVDPQVMNRGVAWLEANINAPIQLPEKPDSAQAPEPNIQAYALWVLARGGKLDAALADQLLAGRDKLDSFALGSLTLALAAGGRTADSDKALDSLVARARTSATTAWWPLDLGSGERWPWYYWYAMSSGDKSTALALEALATLRPNDPLAPKAARWLLEHKQGYGWSSTQATAFSIMGLTDFIISSGELDAAYNWRAELDGQVVAQGQVDRSNVAKAIPSVILKGAGLDAGTHVLNLVKEGRGTLYYTVLGRMALYHPSFAAAKAIGQGIQIERSYEPLVGRSDENGWHVGDLVSVELNLTLDDAASYLIIEDKLPAGLEALNENLDTETQRPPDDRPGKGWPWWWWYRYERKEIRDDKVSFFSTQLPAGEHRFQYTARAITPGTFSARPAEAYAMYRPDVWGRSDSQQLLIAADRVAARPILTGDQDRDCRLTDFDARLVAADWLAGSGRDLTGDGRVSARDVATAAGRARKDLACGEQVSPLATDAGTAQLSLVASGVQGQEVTVDIRLQSGGNLGSWEALLDLPAGATLVSAQAGTGLPGGMLLGSAVEGGQLRIGGWAPVGVSAAQPVTVGRVKLRLVSVTEGRVGVAAAGATTDEGGAYKVQADGVDVPDLVAPLAHRIFLPRVLRAQ